MRFVDSHVHISDYAEQDGTLRLAQACRFVLFAASVDEKTSRATLQAAGAPGSVVRAFVGQHPSEAAKHAPLDWFEPALRQATGAGELGLDPRYPGAGSEGAQMTAFIRQMETVEEARKPVQVHSRGAERDCLEALATFNTRGVLMHWFEGEDEVPRVADKGYYASFGPALLYSKRLQRMALRLDPDLVLAESDGPVPFAALGGAGGPALVPSVVLKLAELWGLPFSDARDRIARNSLRFLG